MMNIQIDPLCASPLGFVGVTSARITKPPKTTIETPNELTKKASVEQRDITLLVCRKVAFSKMPVVAVPTARAYM